MCVFGGCVALCKWEVCDSVCGCVTLWVHLVCGCVSLYGCPGPLAALGGVSAPPDVGRAGSSLLPLWTVGSSSGGALVELGGGELMPFLLMHNVTAATCVKRDGETQRSPQAWF